MICTIYQAYRNISVNSKKHSLLHWKKGNLMGKPCTSFIFFLAYLQGIWYIFLPWYWKYYSRDSRGIAFWLHGNILDKSTKYSQFQFKKEYFQHICKLFFLHYMTYFAGTPNMTFCLDYKFALGDISHKISHWIPDFHLDIPHIHQLSNHMCDFEDKSHMPTCHNPNTLDESTASIPPHSKTYYQWRYKHISEWKNQKQYDVDIWYMFR